MAFLSFIVLSLMLANVSDAEFERDNIAAYWKMDEGTGDTIGDSSGNGNDGQNAGAKWIDGVEGGGLEFVGGGFVNVPHSASLDITDEISITAWIKTTAGGMGSFIGKDDDSGQGRCWHFCVEAGKLRFTVFPGHVQLNGVTTVNDGKWNFAAATFDGKNHKVYVNAEEDGVMAKAGPLPSVDEPVQLGLMDDVNGGGWFYYGFLDEVAIYNVALTQADIEDIMNNGLGARLAVSPKEKLATTWATLKIQW